MEKVSAFILAYNEAEKIAETLKTIQWCDEIVVIDSFSTDATPEIARNYGAKVVNVAFEGFGKLRNAGIEHTQHDWIFSIDADERCTPAAEAEIKQIVASATAADAYLMPRINFFMGQRIRFCGWYPNYRQPQLFRRGKMTFPEDDLVHEGYKLNGKLEKLCHPIEQLPFRNLDEVIHKCNRYSSLGAEKLMQKGRRSSITKAFFRGIWAFLRLYILRGGILDGKAGFVLAIGNFEGTFYRYAKLVELWREKNENRTDNKDLQAAGKS